MSFLKILQGILVILFLIIGSGLQFNFMEVILSTDLIA